MTKITSKISNNLDSEQYSVIVDNIWKTYKVPLKKRNSFHKKITSFILRRARGHRNLHVFKGLSFKVRKGEILGIIGVNGSGKSTLLKMLAGIIFPDKGTINVRGKILPFIELGVGFDFTYTAEDNVLLYGTLLGLSRKEIKQKKDIIFDFAELDQYRRMKIRNFSAGMLIRLAFAIAIQIEPDILLIDEIITVGDQHFKEKSFKKINEFLKRKKTIIFVSHDLKMVEEICNKTIWLDNGNIASYGKSEEVIQKYLNNIK